MSTIVDFRTSFKASTGFARCLSYAETLHHTLQSLNQISGATKGDLLALESDKDPRVVASSTGLAIQIHPQSEQLTNCQLPNQTLIGAGTSKKCIVDAHKLSPEVRPAEQAASVEQTASSLVLPIGRAADVSLVAYLRHDSSLDFFTADKIESLSMLGDQAARELEKNKAYQALEQQNQELRQDKTQLELKKKELEDELQLRITQLTRQNEQMSNEIQQRRDMQKELVAAKETAETATAMKSRFLAMMSHEMRTPFNSVIGFSTLLLDTKLTTEQEDMAQSIVNSSTDLVTLINDILDFSKIESDKMNLDPIWFDARTLVESTLEVVSRTASEKNIDLAYFELPDTAANWIYADNSRLRQCLLNLLSNAVKFTPEKGVVTVETSLQDIDFSPKTGDTATMLRVIVKDNGIGIAEADRGKLFQFFSQVDDSTTRRFGGTGLGLAISQKICRLFKGDLTCESKLGEGSTFTATFEVKYNRKDHPSEKVSSKALQEKTSLILEPSPTLRSVLEQHLSYFGMSTICRSNLDEIDSVTDKCDLAIIGDSFNQPETIIALRKRGLSVLRLPLVVLMPFGATMPQQPTSQDLDSIDAVVSTPVRRLRLFRSLESLYPSVTGVAAFAKPTQHNLKTIASPAETYPRQDIVILLVEDNLVNVKVATQVLKRLGYSPKVAHDGMEAVAAYSADHFDLILMDLSMPRMGGLEATREIRSAQTGRRPPFICAMTANATTADREKCTEAGMDDFLAKPVMMPKLKIVLDKVRDIVTGTLEGQSQLDNVDHEKIRNSREIEREEKLRRNSIQSFLEDVG